jgi:hypothetical protein
MLSAGSRSIILCASSSTTEPPVPWAIPWRTNAGASLRTSSVMRQALVQRGIEELERQGWKRSFVVADGNHFTCR